MGIKQTIVYLVGMGAGSGSVGSGQKPKRRNQIFHEKLRKAPNEDV